MTPVRTEVPGWIDERVGGLCDWLDSFPAGEWSQLRANAEVQAEQLNQHPEVRTSLRLIAHGFRLKLRGSDPRPFLRAAFMVMHVTAWPAFIRREDVRGHG